MEKGPWRAKLAEGLLASRALNSIFDQTLAQVAGEVSEQALALTIMIIKVIKSICFDSDYFVVVIFA